ncbi:hypothetical protein FRB98_009568 [Tulasnella sp. 332]|nr:hypothetical protein FRB98_009568 [Tulasnella sp. 332]
MPCITLHRDALVVERTIYSISKMLLPGRGCLMPSCHEDEFVDTSETNPLELNITSSEMNSMAALRAKWASGVFSFHFLLHDDEVTIVSLDRYTPHITLTVKQCNEALYIATLWHLIVAQDYIIERISTLFTDQPPIDRIALGDRCGVTQWLHPVYETLCTRTNPPAFEEHIEKLGVKRIVALQM